jgi:hypothetical protein
MKDIPVVIFPERDRTAEQEALAIAARRYAMDLIRDMRDADRILEAASKGEEALYINVTNPERGVRIDARGRFDIYFDVVSALKLSDWAPKPEES